MSNSESAPIDTVGETLAVGTANDTEVDNLVPEPPAPKHAYGCVHDRCVPECPLALLSLSDSELENLITDSHQIGAWTLRYLTDESGDADEGLIARGIRLFGGKRGE